MPEDEWDEFIRVLRKPLPAAFRINSRSVKLNFFPLKWLLFKGLSGYNDDDMLPELIYVLIIFSGVILGALFMPS